jgi:hypothetical protein
MSSELELLKGLNEEYARRVKNINALRIQLSIETEPLSKNKYEYQLAEEELALQRVQERIQNLTSIHSFTGRSLLGNKLAELGIGRSLGNLDLVNCNREKPKDAFWDYYDNLEPQRFKFYFLTSCDTQKPGSFAERMLYEFIEEELDQATDAMYYRCDPRYSELRRPEIEDLPKGRNLDKCQQAFQKYFAEFWKLPDTQSMDEYLKTGLPRFGYDAVAMLFRLEESDWKEGVTGPYMEWIIDTLQTTHPDVPQVLVFLEIVVVKAHEKGESLEQSSLFQDLRAILKQHPGVAHLLPFGPVSEEDVKRWFRDIKTENTALLDGLIESFANSMDPADRRLYEAFKQFNMDDIEILQKEVFKVVNKTHI